MEMRSVTLVQLGCRARCTEARLCKPGARLILSYADAGGRPMNNVRYIYQRYLELGSVRAQPGTFGSRDRLEGQGIAKGYQVRWLPLLARCLVRAAVESVAYRRDPPSAGTLSGRLDRRRASERLIGAMHLRVLGRDPVRPGDTDDSERSRFDNASAGSTGGTCIWGIGTPSVVSVCTTAGTDPAMRCARAGGLRLRFST
jgi:hypothetical protein